MSLADTLLADFSDEDSASEFSDSGDIRERNPSSNLHHNVQELLTISDLDSILSIEQYVSVLPKLKYLEKKLDNQAEAQDRETSKLASDEQSLISETNNMITEINNNFNTLYSFVKFAYARVWPDLENIVKNPLYYIKVIGVIHFDISSFKEHIASDDFNFLPKDLILSLTMSLNFLLKSKHSEVPQVNVQHLILEACEIMSYINELQLKFRAFVTKRVQKIAPNVTALVGTTVAAQLIATIGLEALCSTPACNIPSIGKSISRNSLGYVYQSDPLRNVPDDFKRQAVRQLCAKISLSARVDCSPHPEGSADGTYGLKWKDEIMKKLDKMMSPPENVRIKPLPKPIDMKSKRRGGRKFKKMRQRMNMSEVEKAQNKMLFGEQELTKTDAFGEEIGLGMLGKTSIRNIEDVRGVHVTQGTRKALEKFTSNGPDKGTEDGVDKLMALLGEK